MIVKKAYPPNYEQIVTAFNIKGRPGIIFTYGNTIYAPDGTDVSPDLYAHEETHYVQQTVFGMTPELWWDMYIRDPKFRLTQEIEAYRNQYTFAMVNYGRDQRRRLLKHISKALAGPMYGNLMTPEGAKKMITS